MLNPNEREREKQRVLPSSLKSNLYHRSSTPSSHSLTSTPTPPKEPRLSVLWALPSEEPNERERKMWRKKKMCLCWFDLGCLGLGMVEVGVDPGGFCYLILVWSWICCPRFDFVFVVIGESFLLWVGKKICLTKIQKFFFSFIYFLWVGISCQHLLLFNKIVNSAFVSITNNNDQNKTRIKVNDQIYSNLIKFSTRS